MGGIFDAYGTEDPAGNNLAGMAGGAGSPGQPTGGGKGKAGKYALAAGIGSLLALIGSKASGGALNFGEGLAAVGTGFAKDRYDALKQKRDADFTRENELLDAAHKLVTVDIPKLDPLIMQKYPQLGQLAQKYTMALAESGDGGKTITPKEQNEIIVQYHLATQAMGSAQHEQQTQDTQERSTEQDRLQAAQLTGANIPDPSVSQSEREGLISEGMGDISNLRQQEMAAKGAQAEASMPQVMPGYESLGKLSPAQRAALQGHIMSQEDNAARRTLQRELTMARIKASAGRQGNSLSARAMNAWVARRAKYVSDYVKNPRSPDPAEVQRLEEVFEMMDQRPTGGEGLGQRRPTPSPAAGGKADLIFVPGKGLQPNH